jgi:hypothetical protein
MQGFVENASLEQRLSGNAACSIIRCKPLSGSLMYFAWTRTWEGSLRPDYWAAMADLIDFMVKEH